MAGSSYATASRSKYGNSIEEILEYLKNSNDHTVTAADVDEYLKKHDSEVNITTIYRYLDKLAKDGTVIKYVAEKGCQAAYQYVEPGRGCEQHLHLKCVKCGKIIWNVILWKKFLIILKKVMDLPCSVRILFCMESVKNVKAVAKTVDCFCQMM